MSSPFFSIITPNYNSGESLLRAVNSLSENFVPFEHIIVDDCSTDSSLDCFLENLGSLKIIKNEKNLGPGPSRNRGLEVANGKYVIFLDADDYFREGALDYLKKIIDDKGFPDLVLFGYQLVRKESDAVDGGLDKVESLSQEELLKNYLLDRVVSAPWGKCIKSSLAKKHKFPSYRVSQDAFYNLDVMVDTASTIMTLKKIYVFDKCHSGSLTSKPFDKQEFLKFYKSWFFFKNHALCKLGENRCKGYLSAREVNFCVIYYINRMACNYPDHYNSYVVGVIKEKFLENLIESRSFLTKKTILTGLFFLVSPRACLWVVKRFYFN